MSHESTATAVALLWLGPWQPAPVISVEQSRLDRKNAEIRIQVQHAYTSESRGCERYREPFLRLSRIGREPERNSPAWLQHTPYFSQPCHGIGPNLHRVDRQSFVERIVIERHGFY